MRPESRSMYTKAWPSIRCVPFQPTGQAQLAAPKRIAEAHRSASWSQALTGRLVLPMMALQNTHVPSRL